MEELEIISSNKGIYWAVNVGDVIASRYQVVAKLGYVVTSILWLVQDLLPNTICYLY